MRGGISLAFAALLLVPAGLAAAPAGAQVWQTTDHELREEIARQAPKELRAFYAARNNRPIWLDAEARPGPALELLYGYLESAEVEGIDPRKLKLRDLTRALDKAESRDSDDLARLDVTASRVFAGYVDAVRRTPPAPMIYESAALAPVVPTSAATLQTAAAAPDLAGYLRDMRWMHPLYAPIRQALTAPQYDPGQRRQLQLSLDRIRALPAMQSGRHVLIDAASARLWMYEGTQVVGTMRVVVGKPETQTPVMAGFLRYAIVNPYWNLPDNLMPSRITDKVLAQGPGYLAANRYQVLSGWDDDAAVLDPRKVDWRGVAAGTVQIRARQLPGRDNFMGRVKYMFPNPQGIYLHDTPERDLLTKPARQYSNGCVRLEDAAGFGRWLLGKPLPRETRKPEQRIELAEPVPLYITYLTALPEGARIAFRPDVYGLDHATFAGTAGADRAR